MEGGTSVVRRMASVGAARERFIGQTSLAYQSSINVGPRVGRLPCHPGWQGAAVSCEHAPQGHLPLLAGHIEGRLGAPAPVEGGLSGGAGPPNHASQPPRGAQLRSPLLLAARQVPPAPAPAGPSGDRPSTLLAVSRGRSRALLLPDCHIEGGVHVHPVHVSLVSALQALHLKARICRRRGGRGACALRHVVQVPPPSHHGSCSPVVGSGARAEEFASACRGHPPGL